jgi:hypothetical protein
MPAHPRIKRSLVRFLAALVVGSNSRQQRTHDRTVSGFIAAAPVSHRRRPRLRPRPEKRRRAVALRSSRADITAARVEIGRAAVRPGASTARKRPARRIERLRAVFRDLRLRRAGDEHDRDCCKQCKCLVSDVRSNLSCVARFLAACIAARCAAISGSPRKQT